MPLKRARIAVLPAAALAAWASTIWIDTLPGIDTGRDDLVPAILTVVLSVWTLLDFYSRKFWRDTRKVKFDNAVAAIAEGFRGGAEFAAEGKRDGEPSA